MELSSLQVCMSSPDWLQGTIHEETGIDSSSPSGDILTCTRQPNLMEQSRRLRPPHDQPLKCPRCDSTHTKFCYYNNYSLSQPRYFCKTCRRYWTKGGTLRNVPVGGGCKKNKKVSSSKKSSSNHNDHHNINGLGSSSGGSGSSLNNDNRSAVSADLQLSFPEVQFSHIANLLGNHFGGFGNNITPNNPMLENPSQIEFMMGSNNNKYGASLVGNSNGGDHHHLGMINEMTSYNPSLMAPNFHNFCSPYAMSSSLDHVGNNTNNNHGAIMDINCQRLMLPYDQYPHEDLDQTNVLDVKPNAKLLSMEWHDQGNYFNGVGSSSSSWQGLMNGYGSSSTSHLV